jgi:aryl-alcohol dehydrogenase-like predicted oxidoreductase
MTIPTRKLGGQGLEVSALGLGCMGMSQSYGEGDRDESIATIHRALDLGVTFLDTADVYGQNTNEELVGAAIKQRRDEVVLATKFGIAGDPADASVRTINGQPDYVRSACDASLRRLGVDHIDLYYQHRVDRKVPIEDTVGAMGELVGAGKVRYLGLSEPGPETLRRAHATFPISALQNEWSLWARDLESGLLPVARELGIGIVPYSPLGRGFLTGQIKSPDDFDEDDFRRALPKFQGENFDKNLELVEKVRQLADQRGVTAGQLALAWVMAQGDDVAPIPGTKRRQYLEENAGAVEVTLRPEDLAALDAIMPPGAAAGARYADMRFVGGEAPLREDAQ